MSGSEKSARPKKTPPVARRTVRKRACPPSTFDSLDSLDVSDASDVTDAPDASVQDSRSKRSRKRLRRQDNMDKQGDEHQHKSARLWGRVRQHCRDLRTESLARRAAIEKEAAEDTCPLCMDKLTDCETTFTLVWENGENSTVGIAQTFDAEQLALHCLSGRLFNPLTREPLNDIELVRLSRVISKNARMRGRPHLLAFRYHPTFAEFHRRRAEHEHRVETFDLLFEENQEALEDPAERERDSGDSDAANRTPIVEGMNALELPQFLLDTVDLFHKCISFDAEFAREKIQSYEDALALRISECESSGRSSSALYVLSSMIQVVRLDWLQRGIPEPGASPHEPLVDGWTIGGPPFLSDEKLRVYRSWRFNSEADLERRQDELSDAIAPRVRSIIDDFLSREHGVGAHLGLGAGAQSVQNRHGNRVFTFGQPNNPFLEAAGHQNLGWGMRLSENSLNGPGSDPFLNQMNQMSTPSSPSSPSSSSSRSSPSSAVPGQQRIRVSIDTSDRATRSGGGRSNRRSRRHVRMSWNRRQELARAARLPATGAPTVSEASSIVSFVPSNRSINASYGLAPLPQLPPLPIFSPPAPARSAPSVAASGASESSVRPSPSEQRERVQRERDLQQYEATLDYFINYTPSSSAASTSSRLPDTLESDSDLDCD